MVTGFTEWMVERRINSIRRSAAKGNRDYPIDENRVRREVEDDINQLSNIELMQELDEFLEEMDVIK